MRKYRIILLIIIYTNILNAQTIIDNNKTSASFINKEKVYNLAGKPISFFLNHPDIDTDSKRFYKGELAITSNSITYRILDNTITSNSETRPFYFFILNRIVAISDNSLMAEVSFRCKGFIELYPCDFFQALNQPDVNVNIVKWTTYVGLSLSGAGKYLAFKNSVDTKIKSNCIEIQDLWKSFSNEVRMCIVK